MDAPRFSRTSCQHGFSLTELLVVMALAGVLATATVAAMSDFGHSMKLTSFTNTFVSGLHLARSEAIKRRTRVALCKSADGRVCAQAGGWEQGWIAFEDRNNNGQRDPSESLVQHIQALPHGWRVGGNQNVSRYVSFEATGETRLLSGGFQAGTITICRRSPAVAAARKIVINAVGRARVERTSVQSCT
jgi:type IV fimbrial biogenesis protein FimT